MHTHVLIHELLKLPFRAGLQRPFSAASAIDLGVGCPDLSTMAARRAPLVFQDINWVHCRRRNRIMPTLVRPAEDSLGNLWISSLDPVLDVRWLEERQVFRISIATLLVTRLF
jgi:hypothetical protein